MTKVRTRIIKKSYALTSHKQSILILDSYGLINVIEIDHMDGFLRELQIDNKKAILIEDLINANLIISFAEKIGLIPGLFIEGDVAIVDYIRRFISDDIETEDKEILIQELKESWARIYQHPLVQDYIPLGEHYCMDNALMSPHFPAIGALPFFMTNYYTGLVKLFLSNQGASFNFFLQLSELIISSSKGIPYCQNHFLQIEHVIDALKRSENQCVENEDIHALLIKIQTIHNEQTLPWLRRIVGWVQHELVDIKIDFPDDCGIALGNLLERHLPLSNKDDLKEQLEELWQYLHWPQEKANPLMTSVKFPRKAVHPQLESSLCTEAIEYGILHYAQVHEIIIYRRAPLLDIPMFYLAGQSDDQEMHLLSFLENENNCQGLKPFEFFAMARKCKRLELQERVNYELDKKIVGEKFSHLVPIFSGLRLASPFERFERASPSYTPKWSKVSAALKGNTENQSKVVSEAKLPKMEEVLHLRDDRGCCIC
jgi:hypothetical protein